MSFRVQTADGDLPEMNKVYVHQKTAVGTAIKFMENNHQVGQIDVSGHHWTTIRHLYRDTEGSSFVEEIIDPDTYDLIDTIYH